MPELKDTFDSAPIFPYEDYIVDVKIHMLMPNQYPCIPNWHYDNVPRDENFKQRFDLIDESKTMFLWVSSEPLTEFKETGIIKAKEWFAFNQKDLHRGTMSKIHTWRTFIRLTPEPLLKPAPVNKWIRRHSQVYLDVNNFKW